MCDEWRDDFLRFVADVGERPSKAYSLDRIDNDGNYEPGNVRWATAKEQAENRGHMTRFVQQIAELQEENRRLLDALEGREREVTELRRVLREVQLGSWAARTALLGAEAEIITALGEGGGERE